MLDVQLISVSAIAAEKKDRFGRRMYRPVADLKLDGILCRVFPLGFGLYSSKDEAVTEIREWSRSLGATEWKPSVR